LLANSGIFSQNPTMSPPGLSIIKTDSDIYMRSFEPATRKKCVSLFQSLLYSSNKNNSTLIKTYLLQSIVHPHPYICERSGGKMTQTSSILYMSYALRYGSIIGIHRRNVLSSIVPPMVDTASRWPTRSTTCLI
jgi:hypothetical protein